MDSATDIANCKRLLEQLETDEKITSTETLIKLANIFDHLPTQVAPRLQKDYDYCTTKSDEILGNLFDKVDISDKSVLNLLLRLLLGYGNFRIAQITYHIESYRDEVEPDLRYKPIIIKTKWYDLTPLLPPAGTIGWKAICVHSSVKDPDQFQLNQTCSELLIQKLHFYSIISLIDRFRNQHEIIQKNGFKVAEKLAMTIFDCANDDAEVVNIDPFLFNLLSSFTNIEQQAALIEATIVARFKSSLPPELEFKQAISKRKLNGLFSNCLMNKSNFQEIFIVKLIEQLKYNIIRRKRRHSIEAADDTANLTLESLLNDILNGVDPIEIIDKAQNVNLSSKNLQKAYLKQWVLLLHDTFTRKTLTPKSSVLTVLTSSVLLICTSNSIDHDLNMDLSLILAKTIDITSPRKLDKFFKLCGPKFLSSLTKNIVESTDLLEHFETPLMRFYRSYISRYMRYSTYKGYQKDAEKFAQFIEFICDKTTIGKSKSHILEYIFLCELSNFLESIKSNGGGKLSDIYVEYGKTISKSLYKFIKHRPFTKHDEYDNEICAEPINGDNGSTRSHISDQVQIIVIDALVCILKIAVDRNERLMLDNYGELMLKLYNLMSSRFEELLKCTRLGLKCDPKAIDAYLHRLMNLYTTHREIIEPYLCYDLNARISEKLLIVSQNPDTDMDETPKENKTAIYESIKSKLELLSEKDNLVYQSIINSQYSSIVDQAISQVTDMESEDLCYKRYLAHMASLSEVLTILFHNCDLKMYQNVLSNVVKQFELCDALHHPQVLNLFYVLESLIPKQSDKDNQKANLFKQAFPTIGCCLIRIAKSVELGPSVVAFSNSGTHKSNGGIQCCTYSHCIRIYALIFTRFPPTFTNSLITDAMQICISSNLARYAKYSNKLHKFFIQLASSIATLLKAICMGKRDVVEPAMPVFLSMFSLLIRCIILASDRQKLEDLPRPRINGYGGDTNGDEDMESTANHAIEDKCKIYETQLEHLARDVGRLLNNLCFLETKLVDYAPHLISTYIKDTQRASCPDFVKKHLDEGMFRIFNLVDAYQKDRQDQVIEAGIQRKMTAGRASGSLLEMIHARLDQASREIFKNMHVNYSRFHRYLGKC